MWCIISKLLFILPLLSVAQINLSQLPEYLSQHIDPQVDPCKDFYNYACGNWAKAHSNRSFGSQLEQLDHIYNRRLADMLEKEEYVGKGNLHIIQLLKTNYNACRKLSREPYKPAKLINFLVEWSGQNPRGNPNWIKLLSLMLTFGLQEVLGINMDQFDKDRNRWLTQIRPLWPQFWEEVEETEEIIFEPLKLRQFHRLLEQLNFKLDNRNLWRKIKHLEKQIVTIDLQDDYNENEDKDDILLPSNWILPLPSNASIPTFKYLERLSLILEQQSPALLAPYLLLRLQHRLEYSLGVSQQFSRLACSSQTRQFLTHAAIWLMKIPKDFEMIKSLSQKVFIDLKRQFKVKLIENRNKFSRESQHFLFDKLEKMRLRLSVLPSDVSESNLEQLLSKHYENLHLNSSDYYGNVLKLIDRMDYWKSQSVEDFYLIEFDGYGSFASPFFLPKRNEMILPLSLFGPPIFRSNQSNLLTFSSLGFLIGHELSHGFTSRFAFLYDSQGHRIRGNNRSYRRFRKQGNCFRNLYGSDMGDEKFADFMGLTIALKAYSEMEPMKITKAEREIFFLNFAQFFCDDQGESQDFNAEHGGNRERVNEAIEYLPIFRPTFNCNEPVKGGALTQCKLY